MQHIVYGGEMVTHPRGRAEKAARRLAQDLAEGFAAAAEGCGLPVHPSAILSVNLDDYTISVRLRSGLLVEDLAANAHRIAEALGIEGVVFERTRPGHVRVLLLDKPAAMALTVPLPVRSVHDPILLGVSESGHEIRRSFVDMLHIAVQGQTRSGKSFWCYAALMQLAEAPDVIVAGSDPTGILLRPWAKRTDHHAGWQALGMTSVAAHIQVLDRLVKRMDARIAEIPADSDHLEVTTDNPLMLCVLEEFPGLMRQASKAEKEAIRALYGRLVSEGAKAGIRVLLIVQRADADVLGGYERAQCPTRISFSVDSDQAIKMLHPNAPMDAIATHATANPGVALISLRGRPADRMVGPNPGHYSVYVNQVSP